MSLGSLHLPHITGAKSQWIPQESLTHDCTGVPPQSHSSALKFKGRSIPVSPAPLWAMRNWPTVVAAPPSRPQEEREPICCSPAQAAAGETSPGDPVGFRHPLPPPPLRKAHPPPWLLRKDPSRLNPVTSTAPTSSCSGLKSRIYDLPAV